MQKLTRIITFSATLALISGCSYVGVYKRDIPQGNLITQDMVEQLQPGMTREQVTYVMGRPLLEAPFDSSEWDYVFRLDKAYSGVETRRVTLTFNRQGQLTQIDKEGDISDELPLDTETSLGPAIEGTDPLDALPSDSTETQPPEPERAPAPRPY
ncbi:outer membrane protein assembly factor BamE [Vreelandella massiliensis]|uniref:outer membrane protein assembly factor BamE n=1 Tax=Vreelandella massiliensis TaxID=1816686 RepID=UPI00096ACB2A|nr:outer membrane protein assembly factor BamE [Halomonas massiliensis]MYL25139.1 outer membrane protein assembly factor BamE [Halomonas alkaliantarctica]